MRFTLGAMGFGAWLAAVGAGPASAEFVRMRDDVAVSGWTVAYWQDSEGGRAKWCTFYSPTVNGFQLRANFGQQLPPDPRVLRTGMYISNDAWELGAGSRGQVSVEINKVARSVEFARVSPTLTGTTNLPVDEATNGWLAFMLSTNDPTVVRFPNGESFTIPPPSDSVAPAAFDCMLPLYRK